MQATVDIITGAATTSGVFNKVTDAPPDEIASASFPVFIQYGDNGNPQVVSTKIYEGTIDYTCYILASASADDWSDLDSYLDSYLTALFATNSARAVGLELVSPFRRYQVQVGVIKCLVREFTIRSHWSGEYE